MTSWQQDRRRAASRQFTSDNARALASLVGGLGDARDMLLDDEERKRKKDADTATQGLLRARTDAAKTTAESGLLKAKADEATSQEKLLRAKSESEEKSARVTREAAADEAKKQSDLEKSSMEALRVSARAPDANVETLIGRASVDPGLGNLDDTAVAGILAEEQAKAGADAAVTDKNVAAAEKARRKPVAKAPSPEAVELRNLRLRQLRAQVAQLEGGKGGGKPMSPSDVADLTNERVTIDSLSAIREMAKDPEIMTGAVRGRIEKAVATVSDSAKWTKFTTAVQIANKLIARAVEGGRMTDADARYYQEILANPEKGPGQFNATLDLMEQLAGDTLQAKLTALGESGYLVPESVKAKPKAPAAAPAPSAKVRVSNGQEILEIDRADLGDALADGYKVVR